MVSRMEASKPATILIVEDDPLVASTIRQVLHESGFAVAGVASTGAEAISLAGARPPQLALIDIRLAGPMDGIEVACALREQLDIPAIFLSGLADAQTVARAKRARPLGFLRKPFRPSQVFNTIERVLNRPQA